MSSKDDAADTVPKLFQVVVSVEYCHVPLPVVAVMAMPLSALVSTSARLAPVKKADTRDDVLVVSSLVVVRLVDAPLVMVGASLTEVETTLVVFVLVVVSVPSLIATVKVVVSVLPDATRLLVGSKTNALIAVVMAAGVAAVCV